MGHDPVKAQPQKQEPPRGDLGGKRRVVFGEYAGSARLGPPFKASHGMTLGLLGYAGAVIRIQPLIGWTEPLRLETC